MTSEVEALKTNEFLRRRKLRIQQVREQSKDIAKKIRQRASAEKLRRCVDLNTEKGKQYLEQQDKLVHKLEQLYAKSLENVGASHKKAAEVTQEGDKPARLDLSKQRARVAATELRRQKQEKLDERKKSLDRKLIAREIANEISRDKSSSVASKVNLQTVKTAEEAVQVDNTETIPEQTSTSDLLNVKDDPKVTNDMATQWTYEPVPSEWEPHIPVLSLPKDDTKESSPKNKSDRSKRPNLFALSDEMPSSLRGGLASVPEETSSIKPSLTLVSDYIQNRDLRLREPDAIPRKPSEDLQKIRQTIIRTRAAKTSVSAKSSNIERPAKVTQPTHPDSILNKKSSVTMYNHSTRDIKDVPYGDKKLVIRDSQDDNDAYSQAMKESATEMTCREKEHQKKLQEMRNKIAVTKQNVDKEYKDTMTFLKTLSKDKPKPIRSAYKDDHQQQVQKECRQRKLQSEFRKIQKECKKHPHSVVSNVSSHKAKSPVNVLSDDDFEGRDFQYSWMPVPESDGNLAIHTIPTTVKDQKSGNSVKFSKVDSYHEYRSRHKHTPPTKDVSYHEKQKQVFISDHSDDGSGTSASDSSSVENLRLNKSKHRQKKHSDDGKLSDAERIIIYKILDTKSEKRDKCSKSSRAIKDIAKSLSLMTKDRMTSPSRQEENNLEIQKSTSKSTKHAETRVSFEQLKEGVYKTVNENGENVASVDFSDNPQKQTQLKEQSSENTNTGAQKSSMDRGCECDFDALKVQSGPSATTSTSSFKTATNDKGTSLIETDLKMSSETTGPSDTGFIKFVDDKGQESGKFYIGATGFLKDDAYEVIIQLRKKDGTQVDSKEIQSELVEETNAKTIEHHTSKDENSQSKTFDKRVQIPPVVEHASTQNNLDYNASMNQQVSDNITNEQFVQKVELTDNPSQNNYLVNVVNSQGVYTSAQESYAIPANFTKVDLDAKPANSVSTQTTLGSPQRPVFIHMSSSTSTAYMSPPEFILPAFLKHRRLDSISDDPTELPYEHARVGNVDCYENDDCVFDQYMPARRSPVPKPKGFRTCIPPLTKIKQMNRKFRAPPNTARSTSSGYEDRDTYYSSFRKKPTLVNSFPKTTRKCTKCEKLGHNKLCHKSHRRKSRLNIPSNRDLDRRNMKQANSSSSRHKLLLVSNYAQIDHRKLATKDLNPMVKWYVDRLLKMNKQGLRAIDVANQECSAVSTPGSSIIDVPHNIDKSKPTIEAKISLEQIKETIAQQLLDKCSQKCKDFENDEFSENPNLKRHKMQKNSVTRIPRKKSLHKVKSLNISRKLVSCHKESWRKPATKTSISTSDTLSPKHAGDFQKFEAAILPRAKGRSKSSPSPRRTTQKLLRKNNSSDIIYFKSSEEDLEKLNDQNLRMNKARKQFLQQSEVSTDNYKDFKPVTSSVRHQKSSIPLSTSTQTSQVIDEEINYIKLAESKLQNMEKIADLTEKCTQRLSNLAKVLDEVRKNKSVVYSQVSDTGSDTDITSVKNSDSQLTSSRTYEPVIEIKEKNSTPPQIQSPVNKGQEDLEKKNADGRGAIGFVPFLKDIPKPKPKKNSKPSSPDKLRSLSVSPNRSINTTPDHHSVKTRGKPPPALSRRGFKHAPEILVPHELSTVIEVDSPLSSKLKSQSVRNESNSKVPNAQDKKVEKKHLEGLIIEREKEQIIPHGDIQKNESENQNNNPDLLQSNASLSRRQSKLLTTDSSDESKLQMMDLNKFNEIMLKPFISIQEYAKQCNMGNLEESSHVENVTRDDVNDEISSLHSDGSLPDVIAELLKRNIINEPFKFDTASNVNSTTISSDSTLSAIALSKSKKDKKKSSAIFSNKENLETSDTLSISSNPDLENAFKKLGMGWASSTLKKTKERLALSSSSNTSSSSLSQYKLKTTNNQQFPALVTDSMSLSTSNAPRPTDNIKNVEQQTSMVNTMTVKQFLTKELAKKITFANKSRRDDTEDEFISLYETKMPDDIKHSSKVIREDRSLDSNNRARTSTPVQIFKSMNYHSSSSSNMSNGLFSNADDLSSVKGTSNSMRNHSTSEKDDLTIPNFSLRTRKGASDNSKSD